MKKFLKVAGVGIICCMLAVLCSSSQRPVAQVVYIISTALAGVVITAAYECVDTHGQGIKLWYQTQIVYRDKPIRLSFSYLYRIKVNGKYLLVRGNRLKNQYQPVGGVYKYYREGKRFLDDIQCKGDTQMRNTEDDDDLRIKIKGKNVLKFFDWFLSMKDREYDPMREFREELIDTKILPQEEFSVIQYRKVSVHKTTVQFSKWMGCDEILYADIFELQPTESQYNILVEKMNSRDDRICWVTEKEIEKLCANGIERNLGTNTPWIVEGEKNE